MERLCFGAWKSASEIGGARVCDPQQLCPLAGLSIAPTRAALLEGLKRGIEERGWGFWVVEIEHEFAGFTGLAEPSFQAFFTPCVEIGWRFQRRFWGRGYAREAAQVALRFGLSGWSFCSASDENAGLRIELTH